MLEYSKYIVPLMLFITLTFYKLYKHTNSYKKQNDLSLLAKLYKEKNYSSAAEWNITLLNRMKLSKKKRFFSYLRIADCYIETEKFDKAQNFLSKAEKLRPEFFLVKLYKAKLLSRSQKFAEAIELYQNVLSCKKIDYICANIALISLKLYDYDLAEKWLLEGMNRFPKYYPQYPILYELYYSKADTDKAYSFIFSANKRRNKDWERQLFAVDVLKGKADKLYKESGIKLSDVMGKLIKLYRDTLSQAVYAVITDEKPAENCSFIGTPHYLPPEVAYPLDKEGNEMRFLFQVNLDELPKEFIQQQNLPLTGFFQFFTSENSENPELKSLYLENINKISFVKYDFPFFGLIKKIVFKKALKHFEPNEENKSIFTAATGIELDAALKIPHVKEFIDKQKFTTEICFGNSNISGKTEISEGLTFAEINISNDKAELKNIKFYFDKNGTSPITEPK